MEKTEWILLPNLDRHCFGCGPENHHGLNMTFASNGEIIRTSLAVPDRFRGWSKLVHGGVISTILDETMSWAAIHLLRKFILTKGMAIQFLRPVYVGTPLVATGYIKEKDGDRRATVIGELHDENGKLCASSEGEFVLYTEKQFRRLNIIAEDDLETMAKSF